MNQFKRFFIKCHIGFLAFMGMALASDPITLDSLYKKQIGLRSVTNLSLLSTGNANTYSLYPNMNIQGDPTLWNDTKALHLNQTLIYTITPKLDIIASAAGNFSRQEYTHYETGKFLHESHFDFNGGWLGFMYTFDSVQDFVPQVTLQTAIMQREKALKENKNFYFKSQSLQVSLRGYSDPVVYAMYVQAGYNQPRNFSIGKIEYGHNIAFGGNLSIILSPKITLDMGAEQRFQTEQKINNVINSHIYSIPTISIGSTYSMESDSSFSFNASLGGSSSAPDAIIGVSLWKKF